MASVGRPRKCVTCKGLAKLTLYPVPPNVGGGMISEAERKALEVPFGKASAAKIRTVADIDNHLSEVSAKYPHVFKDGGFGRPDFTA